MQIYSFGSGAITYFTTSRSLKKAQIIGRENMKDYINTCEEIGEKPEADEIYFIPYKVELISKEWFLHLIKYDDTLILDDELYQLIK